MGKRKLLSFVTKSEQVFSWGTRLPKYPFRLPLPMESCRIIHSNRNLVLALWLLQKSLSPIQAAARAVVRMLPTGDEVKIEQREAIGLCKQLRPLIPVIRLFFRFLTVTKPVNQMY